MKTSVVSGKLSVFPVLKYRTGILLLIVSFLPFCVLKSQNCKLCAIPSFPTVTVYQSFQTGHGMGFGVEAGTWNKDAGRFSYFIGTSMAWAGTTQTDAKSTVTKQSLLSFYVKGQYKLTNHIYVVASPGVVNLSYFEMQTGLRFVVPVTSVIGVGLEPAYAFVQKQFAINLNLHFALK
jgi:hypothetical protein